MRQSMMPVRYSAINKTSNSGQSMMATVMVTAATCNQKEKIEKHVPTPTDDGKGEFSIQLLLVQPSGGTKRHPFFAILCLCSYVHLLYRPLFYNWAYCPSSNFTQQPAHHQSPLNTRRWPRRLWACRMCSLVWTKFSDAATTCPTVRIVHYHHRQTATAALNCLTIPRPLLTGKPCPPGINSRMERALSQPIVTGPKIPQPLIQQSTTAPTANFSKCHPPTKVLLPPPSLGLAIGRPQEGASRYETLSRAIVDRWANNSSSSRIMI